VQWTRTLDPLIKSQNYCVDFARLFPQLDAKAAITNQWVTLKFPTEKAPQFTPPARIIPAPSAAAAAPMPLANPNPEFRELTPRPDTRYLSGRTERTMQGRLPARPDPISYAGSTAALAIDSEFAEPGGDDFAVERRARDAARQAGGPLVGRSRSEMGKTSGLLALRTRKARRFSLALSLRSSQSFGRQSSRRPGTAIKSCRANSAPRPGRDASGLTRSVR
jgi:hypothetical protein